MTRPHSQFFNPQDSQETKFNGQSRLSNNVQVDGLDNNHKTGLLTRDDPVRGGHRLGQRGHLQLRRGVRPRRRLGDHRRARSPARTSSRGPRSSSATPRPRRPRATSRPPPPRSRRRSTSSSGRPWAGPIIKDKLFFFADYQRTVDNLGQLRRVIIPPAEWRNGNFSTAATTIYDPATGNPDGTGRLPFPGNVIPANRISPVAPQHPGACCRSRTSPGAAFGQVNYELPSERAREDDERVQRQAQLQPRRQRPAVAALQLPAAGDLRPRHVRRDRRRGRRLRGHRLPEHLQHGAHLDADAELEPDHGVARRLPRGTTTRRSAPGTGLDTSTEVGIPGANYDDFSSGLSRIVINQGFTVPMVGFSASLPWDRGEETYSVVGTLTKMTGNHTVKFGTEVRHNEDFLLQIQDAGGVRGQFSFNGAQTAIPSDTRATGRARERVRVVPARRAGPDPARRQGDRPPGHQAHARCSRSSRTSGRSRPS